MVMWFKSYLTERVQSVHLGTVISDPITLDKGVTQESVLGPLLFLLYINNICDQLKFSSYHMYADDTILYTSASSLGAAFANLQSDFISLQHCLFDAKLVINANKTKMMFFHHNSTVILPILMALDGTIIEVVDTYKYLGIWLDKDLNLKYHISYLSKKLKFIVSFLYRFKSCFSVTARKRLVNSLFLSQLDYGDTIYRIACPTTLAKLDPIYHAALRYITGSAFRTHHCTLYTLTGFSSLNTRRVLHWYTLNYKAILGKLPHYICSKFIAVQLTHNLRANSWLRFKVPHMRTELGRKTLSHFGPWSWNDLQARMRLGSLIPLSGFKHTISELLVNSCTCDN